MQGGKTAQMESLRARIAALEKRPALAAGALSTRRLQPEGLLTPAPGLLQEIFTDEQRNAGAVLGFALGMARSLLTPARSAILYLQLGAEAQEMGLPYGLGLSHFGIDPEALVIGRMGTITELLWAMEEAIACRAVAAIIADFANGSRVLDFTASRRLSLRAAAAGASVFVLRYGREREASAARLRWQVTPAPSGPAAFDPEAPGAARFAVSVEKVRLGEAAKRLEGVSFQLDWVNHGFVMVEHGRAERAATQPPPLPRAQPAPLGDRLSQTG